MTLLRQATAVEDLQPYVPHVLPWVHEAGNPFFDWIFGGPEAARERLARWMMRPSSEVALLRAQLVFEAGRPVGGFIALGGAELAACRKADALSLLQETPSREGAPLRARLQAVRGLFPRVDPEEFYLSKMGVAAELRGLGRGRRLALDYLSAGRRAGFRRFRLDVWAGNRAARALYESLGFEVAGQSGSEVAELRYLSMVKAETE